MEDPEDRLARAVDVDAFRCWAAPRFGAVGPLKLLTGGESNITIAFDSGTGPLVLRRPPLGHVMQSAHDMAREHAILSVLEPTGVPTPRPVHLATTPTGGVDTEFLIMTRSPGFALESPSESALFTPDERHALSLSLARILAELHAVEVTRPPASDLGRPAGFRERQVSRWSRQLQASRSRDLPLTEKLGARLTDALPSTPPRASLVHGDYKFNNTLVVPADPSGTAHISAVLDWEMAALGDPMTDLAVLGIYWDMPTYSPETAAHFTTPVDTAAGYPAFETLVDTYASHARSLGADEPVHDLPWYLGLAAFKVAVILESLHFRHAQGLAFGHESATAGRLTEIVASVGLRHLRS